MSWKKLTAANTLAYSCRRVGDEEKTFFTVETRKELRQPPFKEKVKYCSSPFRQTVAVVKYNGPDCNYLCSKLLRSLLVIDRKKRQLDYSTMVIITVAISLTLQCYNIEG
jgi:hypothetical protein